MSFLYVFHPQPFKGSEVRFMDVFMNIHALLYVYTKRHLKLHYRLPSLSFTCYNVDIQAKKKEHPDTTPIVSKSSFSRVLMPLL
jgi:hypothetical protein